MVPALCYVRIGQETMGFQGVEISHEARGRDTARNTKRTNRRDIGMRQGRLCPPSRLRARRGWPRCHSLRYTSVGRRSERAPP
jgi:hypothetical protein